MTDETTRILARKILAEAEMGRCAELLASIIDDRAAGDRDSLRGNSDEDLLGAVEGLEAAAKSWRER